jgi:hypothetical protein
VEQHEITKVQKLLDEKGNIIEAGYAKKLLWEYNRENITASKALIKEWDYYYVGNEKYALCVTIADMGYIGALSATVMDFESCSEITKSSVTLFSMGKMKLPRTTISGESKYKNGKVWMSFSNNGKTRILTGEYPSFGKNGETLSFNVTLTDFPEESMVIATPFDKNGRFYFNQKINCMSAEGAFSIGDKKYEFNRENGALGTLDWGRGVWTYDNTWYWGSLQTVLDDGKKFGWNIGYGFGNNDKATENMLFYDGKSYKLDEITFNIPKRTDGVDDFMSPWTFTSNDNRFYMDFTPVIDRYEPFDLKFFAMIPHQVFGRFNGKAVLDDGTEIIIKDRLGFAEKVHNKW